MTGRRSWGQRGVLTVNVVAMAAALFAAYVLSAGENVAASINRVELSGSLTPRADEIPPGGRAFNVLLVGFDSAANLDPDDPIAIGRQGERLADVIIVARIDEREQTARLLSVPRDLWVPIAGLDGERKINSSFQVGGASTLIETIEEYFDVPINNFVSVDLAGFEGLVDVVDHVDLFFEYPSRDFNEQPDSGPPRSMSGFEVLDAGCQSLEPSMALAFVRSRNFQIQVDGEWMNDGQRSDLSRIDRQQLFLEAFIERAIDVGARNPWVLKRLVEEGVEFVTLDHELTPKMLLDIGQTFETFEADQLESYSVPTRFGWEGSQSVVYALEDEAEPLLELFRGTPPDSPATVGVSVRADRSREDEALELVDSLRAAGFSLEDPAIREDLGVGSWMAYGSDGREAIDVVADALDRIGFDIESSVEQDDIPGREVQLTLGVIQAPATSLPADADADAGDGDLGDAGAQAPATTESVDSSEDGDSTDPGISTTTVPDSVHACP